MASLDYYQRMFREHRLQGECPDETYKFIETLILSHHWEITNCLARIRHADREDFLQNLLFKALTSPKMREGYEEAGVRFIVTCLRNEQTSYFRSESRKKRLKELFPTMATTGFQMDAVIDRIKKGLSYLSIQDRAIMERYAKGYTHKNIARDVGRTEAAVRNKISRIKQQLKAILKNIE